jgi:hypothetical protein
MSMGSYRFPRMNLIHFGTPWRDAPRTETKRLDSRRMYAAEVALPLDCHQGV